MRKILVLGAGKSSFHLINYFLHNASTQNWQITVADASLELAKSKTNNHPAAKAVSFDINNEDERNSYVSSHDIIISLLPPSLHYLAALTCLHNNKNLVTASYVSPEMSALHNEAFNKGLIFLNECGLDPGIDHMSAMRIIHQLQTDGAEITSFKSYTGGLISPESNDNPWGYKFTWNPKNVILAGQGTATYRENHRDKFIPYHRLFSQIEKIEIIGTGEFEGYANRNSNSYIHTYNLHNIDTLLRGTLRYSGYCSAWNLFVHLGITDDTYKINNLSTLTYHDWITSYLPSLNKPLLPTLKELFHYLHLTPQDWDRIIWTGILDKTPIPLSSGTPAEILLNLLQSKWKMKQGDLDLVVMQHSFEYTLNGKSLKHTSSLSVKGENETATAMSKTVGLPMAIAAKHILNGNISTKGVIIPVSSEIYNPILDELELHGVTFQS
ncbi:MAG: saccharopine dehydrogenase NADP-binding domain-containing protein [Bacteroidetes bacterium]|jgi:saccharopine dehydrogenase (NADP+, L-glutamate forming)|nr:saccharopine dehydrogenase NADP-binding domain-containing protein [Bacteroidota bacterium]